MLTENEKNEYLKLRRKIISDDFSFLNDKQLEAVLATEGPLLILAGAGSGKTTVLINRIANLIKYGRAGDCEDVASNIEEALRPKLYAPTGRWTPGGYLR